ncbi:EAL domain-containing protein [Clostridium malenominatum]|uniref:EAL domain-containing protein n=1 Tax=Clostridium malenominatum TaxID=1539 RepID=A0ABP3U8R0_9CLOT
MFKFANMNKEGNKDICNSEKMNPRIEALRISVVYSLVGFLWIVFSDSILDIFSSDLKLYKAMQTYKGFIFVLLSSVIIYILIQNKIHIIKKQMEKTIRVYEELSASYEQLTAIEEELREQFNELQKSKNDLIRSEQRYELAVEGANDGIWDWDIPKGKYFFSLNLKESFGYIEGELENKIEVWQSLIHPDDKEVAIKILNDYLKKPLETYKNTYRVRTKNGTYRWILSHGKALLDGEGNVFRFAGSHTDITEQLNIEEYLRRERALSENIMNNVSVIIAIWDKNGKIKRINSFAEKRLGYSSMEVYNNSWLDTLVPKENRVYMKSIYRKIINGEMPLNHESQLISKSGKIVDVLWNSSSIINNEGNITEIISVGTDITERKNLEKKLHKLAYYDSLTGLLNRDMIEVKVENLITQREKDENYRFAFIYLDIDNFKHVNDTLGHFTGDILLKYISDIMKNHFKTPNLIGRLSGDEFVIVLEDIDDREEVVFKLEEVLKDIRVPWVNDENEFFISISMGIAMYPEHGKNFLTLLKNSDTAMFYTKEKGKNAYNFYEDKMREKSYNYLNLVNQLRKAINNEEFALFYQPLINLKSGKIIGVEALIRWIHPEKGFISPTEFIPFSEETGLINEIGEWVLKTALHQKKNWEEKGYKDLKVSINLSSSKFKKGNLSWEIDDLLDNFNVNQESITFEITETAVMGDMNIAIETLKKLRTKGIQIALDDFGTGYSSLTYLKALPIDILKIDREFIQDIGKNPEKEEIVKSVINLGQALSLEVVAEGIETEEELRLLKEYGCDIGQGYLFSRPVPAEEIDKMLEEAM